MVIVKGEIQMKNKNERKMNTETLQGFLHFRKRGFIQKNGKAYNRKEKHKKDLTNTPNYAIIKVH